ADHLGGLQHVVRLEEKADAGLILCPRPGGLPQSRLRWREVVVLARPIERGGREGDERQPGSGVDLKRRLSRVRTPMPDHKLNGRVRCQSAGRFYRERRVAAVVIGDQLEGKGAPTSCRALRRILR